MPDSSTPQHQFDTFVERFISQYNAIHPIRASLLGHHEFDAHLDDISTTALQMKVEWLGAKAKELTQIPVDQLDIDRQVDHTMLGDKISAQLLRLGTTRDWRRNPCSYNDLVTESVHSLIRHPFASLDQRAVAIFERLKQIPQFLATAREHLNDELEGNPDPLADHPAVHPSGCYCSGVPAAVIESALFEYQGSRFFFEHDVPRVLDDVSDVALRREAQKKVAEVVEAYHGMIDWMRLKALPRGSATCALGPEAFRALLRAEEHITTPVEEIVDRAMHELRETQNRMQNLVKQISPGLTVPECVMTLAEECQPAATEVLQAYAQELDRARQFVLQRKLVTLPEGELRVDEMPPFMRDLSVAAIERPGPFEFADLPSFFYVTLPDPQVSHEEQAELLRAHNALVRQTTIIHEAYPGHFVQGMRHGDTPSLVRRTFRGMTLVEGWAHYCEQMLVDEGFDDDPRLRLFQQYDALLRIVRVIAATRMHTEFLTIPEAVIFLQEEGWLEPVLAQMEAHRYTRDPFVLVYSWGKWQLQELCQAYRAKLGTEFSLGKFHDAVLSQGEPPVALLKRLLLEGNGR